MGRSDPLGSEPSNLEHFKDVWNETEYGFRPYVFEVNNEIFNCIELVNLLDHDRSQCWRRSSDRAGQESARSVGVNT